MAIQTVQFVKGVIGSEGLPERVLPVVAFFGRSNVGKSSVINTLFGRKNLARSSSRAGRTTEINYFLVDDAWYLADLPGYGYARRSPALRLKLEKHLSWYAGSEEVDFRAAVLVIDAETGAKASDHKTYDLLRDYGRHIIIVANKADRGGRNAMTQSLRTLRAQFPEVPVIRYSAKTGEGRAELLAVLPPLRP